MPRWTAALFAYNENSDAEERERCREETETLAILTGLEIDSAKSGIRPNLDEYLTHKAVKRSAFLKYKTLVEEAETGAPGTSLPMRPR